MRDNRQEAAAAIGGGRTLQQRRSFSNTSTIVHAYPEHFSIGDLEQPETTRHSTGQTRSSPASAANAYSEQGQPRQQPSPHSTVGVTHYKSDRDHSAKHTADAAALATADDAETAAHSLADVTAETEHDLHPTALDQEHLTGGRERALQSAGKHD